MTNSTLQSRGYLLNSVSSMSIPNRPKNYHWNKQGSNELGLRRNSQGCVAVHPFLLDAQLLYAQATFGKWYGSLVTTNCGTEVPQRINLASGLLFTKAGMALWTIPERFCSRRGAIQMFDLTLPYLTKDKNVVLQSTFLIVPAVKLVRLSSCHRVGASTSDSCIVTSFASWYIVACTLWHTYIATAIRRPMSELL